MGGERLTARPRYAAPTLESLSADEVRELLGPVESQYVMVTTAANCLPLEVGNTVQDNWNISVPVADTRVTITVDVATDNAGCQTIGCAAPPDPAQGPLDPKFALYPPGVAPTAAPFNGFFSAECGTTPDSGCAPKPPDACFMCDNADCTFPATPDSECAALSLNLPTRGIWTIAVAPEAPSLVPQSEGCYVLTVQAEQGRQIGVLQLVGDDTTVTFAPSR